MEGFEEWRGDAFAGGGDADGGEEGAGFFVALLGEGSEGGFEVGGGPVGG